MKFITYYKEFGKGEDKRIMDNISDTPIQGKNKVLEYLKKGKDAGVRCSAVHDLVEKFSTGKTIHRYTDEEYIWDDREIYHFEHYNLALDKGFIEKVLNVE